MGDIKSFIKSKTLWGLVITLIGTFVDLPVPAEEASTILVDIADKGIEIFGLVLAAYGRFTAKTALKVLPVSA